jgi:hypothetical protein
VNERAYLKIVLGHDQPAGGNRFTLRLCLNTDEDQPINQKAGHAGDNESKA